MNHDSANGPKDALTRGLSAAIRLELSGKLNIHSSPGSSSRQEVEAEDTEFPEELGEYRVLDFLARGGVGLVYRVADVEFGRDLAMKILSRRYANDERMIEHFRNEADICSQLQHPGIVPIHHRGELSDGRPFFTMKIVEGETLAELLSARSDPRTGRHKLLEMFERTCQTMAYTHAQGVVHGDLKPANLMIGAFGEVQVMDWGFARVVEQDPARDPSDRPLAWSPRILGTPAYMAPEQARGEESAITTRTDVFGLGAILCEILTGQPPNRGVTRSETFVQASKGWNEETGALLDDCGADPALIDLARRCLASNPADRPEDAGSIRFDVRRYLESVEERSRQLELKAARAETRAIQERKHRKTVLGLSAAIIAAVLAATGSLLWMQERDSKHRQETHRMVIEALARAHSARREAEASPPGQVEPWRRALVAADNALRITSSRDASAEDVESAIDLRADLADATESAERTRGLLDWLHANQPHVTDDRGIKGVDDLYRERFAQFGLDIDNEPEEAIVARIRATPIAELICEALSDWASPSWAAERSGEEPAGDWRKLMRIAQAADPDPFRDRIRAALLANDVDALQELTHSEELPHSSPMSAGLLAKCLFAATRTDHAIEVLRAACVAHPNDYRIIHDLAVFLRRGSHSLLEVAMLTQAATALRPDDPHALADHAVSLFATGQIDAAAAVLSRSLELAPDYERTWLILGTVLPFQGRMAEAVRVNEHALEGTWDDAIRQPILARSMFPLWFTGRFDQARRNGDKSCELDPDDGLASASMAWTDLQAADLTSAWRHIEDNSPDTDFARVIAAQVALESGDFERGLEYLHVFEDSDPPYVSPIVDLDAPREIRICNALIRGAERLQFSVAPETIESPHTRAWTAAAATLGGGHGRAVTWYVSSFDDSPEILADAWHSRWAASAAARLALNPRLDIEERREWSSLAHRWLSEHLATIQIPDPEQPASDSFDELLWIRRIQASRLFAPFWSQSEAVPEGTPEDWGELNQQLEARAQSLLR